MSYDQKTEETFVRVVGNLEQAFATGEPVQGVTTNDILCLLSAEPIDVAGSPQSIEEQGENGSWQFSDLNDANLVGMYGLGALAETTLKEIYREPTPFAQNRISAINFLRFVEAEKGPKFARDMSERLIALNEDVAHDLNSLANMMSAPIQVIGSAGAPQVRNSLTIIVHGTFAKREKWWRKGGDFWDYINVLTNNDVYDGSDPFFWSGKKSHKKRIKAADKLKKWLQNNPTNHLTAIAHSHGANVCFLAAERDVKFDLLITLGCPIRLEYMPELANHSELRNISQLHNIFAAQDSVQTPLGTGGRARGEGRTLAEREKVSNHWAEHSVGGPMRSHSDLHTRKTWDDNKFHLLLP